MTDAAEGKTLMLQALGWAFSLQRPRHPSLDPHALPQELLLQALRDAHLALGVDYDVTASSREGQQRVTLITTKAREIAAALGNIVGPRTRFARQLDL